MQRDPAVIPVRRAFRASEEATGEGIRHASSRRRNARLRTAEATGRRRPLRLFIDMNGGQEGDDVARVRFSPVNESTPLLSPVSRRDRLRAATADAHAQVDALAAPALRSTHGYAAYLRGMHRFLTHGEHALCNDQSAAVVRARRQWIEGDLATLGVAPMPSGTPPAPLHSDADRLGWAYVIAGASLGAKVLLRGVAGLGVDRDRGARFLAGHADGDAWPTLLQRLEATPLSNDDHDRMCAAARAAFAAAADALRHGREEAHA